MRFIILFLVSFPALAFNDWRIECKGTTDDGKTLSVSDMRINGDQKYRMVDINLWTHSRSREWSLSGRTFVERKSKREGFFFNQGKRIDYRLNYLTGFTRLPSESRVDMRVPNAEISMDFYKGISSSSGIDQTLFLKLSCYYRKGGE